MFYIFSGIPVFLCNYLSVFAQLPAHLGKDSSGINLQTCSFWSTDLGEVPFFKVSIK